MRIRRKPWARPELEACPFYIKIPTDIKGMWSEQFPKKQPLYIELGCGKGGFISQIALQRQDINFLAMDIKSEMLGLAKRKVEKAYADANTSVDNVKLLIQNIEHISDTFDKTDDIKRIYINFCNPWPRGKHNKRRLTHTRQLIQYKQFLADDGEIWFKTDDDDLFEESLPYFEETGFKIKYQTHDLHQSGFEENVVTEHEQMFTEEGKKIKFLIATMK